jgi:hypothetical protein
MRRVLLAVVIVPLAAVALLAFQFDVAGTIRKIDAGNGDLLVYVSGQDRSLKIDRAVKVLDMDGGPLTDGLNAKELKEGADVTITLDMRPEGFVVTAIRLGTAGMLEAKDLWADGTTPRKRDGLIYAARDFEVDGAHPGESGRQKVANLLLTFFQTDSLARAWYLKK